MKQSRPTTWLKRAGLVLPPDWGLLLRAACLGAILAIAAAWSIPACAAPLAAVVIVGGKPVPFVVSPYIDDDGRVFAPADIVHLFGAVYVPSAEDLSITITSRTGNRVTVADQLVEGRYCIPLQDVMPILGGRTDWQKATRTLIVRARMTAMRYDRAGVSVETSYPVYCTVGQQPSTNAPFVDFHGVELVAGAFAHMVGGANNIRCKQLDLNTVRISLLPPTNGTLRIVSTLPSASIRVAFDNPSSSGISPVPISPPQSSARQVSTTRPCITGLTLSASSGLPQIEVQTTGKAEYRTEVLGNPNRLAFDLEGTDITPGLQPIHLSNDPLVRALRVGFLRTLRTNYARIVVDLTRQAPFTVSCRTSAAGNTTYLISLQAPRAAASSGPPASSGLSASNNSIIGKVVVVDPSHGADDSGAIGLGGVQEKDLTLAISRRLRDALVRQGAIVFMTREDDVKPSLAERPLLAVTHHADYFISIHCDQAGAVNSHTGTTVYFHAANATCRQLAAEISNRIAEATELTSNGVRSDTIRFHSGFAVLRGSPMPAVLVECGYVNSEQDLPRLCNPESQERIAEGIVAGLRDFATDQLSSRTSP